MSPDKVDFPVRVLIVDDEASYAKALSKRLEVRGLNTAVANSGREAIQTLRKQDFEVILLDLKMEDVDGLETLKVCKIMDPRLKVIILTGHGGEAEAKQSLKLGAFDYLVKPTELDDIIKSIRRAMAGR
ncbi:MAG: response regulator [Desulfovibrio sp.]|uniref:response regulator n=1 Tax=Desulfovibrio sp. 7SRBS1 TaxID=3378064 RepID=UPI003B3F011F